MCHGITLSALFVDVDVGLALDEAGNILGGLLALEEGCRLLVHDVEDAVVIICGLGRGLDKLTELGDLLGIKSVYLLRLAGGVVPHGEEHNRYLLAVLVKQVVAVIILLVLDSGGFLGFLIENVDAAGERVAAFVIFLGE